MDEDACTTPAGSSNAALGNSVSPSPRMQAHLPSCVLCRQRKVKCDRQQPCRNCAKAPGTTCLYPTGRGRAPKRSRYEISSQLTNRLSRLESMVRNLADARPSTPHSETEPSRSPSIKHAPSSDSSTIDEQLGKLIVDETRSYYVRNVLWASLSDEIEDLRSMLTEQASDGEDDGSSSDDSNPLGANAILMGVRGSSGSLSCYHPPLAQSVALFRVFSENVVPLVRIFHMPTTTQTYWDAVGSLDSLDRNHEALLFSIYYSAVVSLEDPEACPALLGVSRESALKRYRRATEQALARADLFNTQSIVLLQASVLFVTVMRHEDDSRTPWALTALICRIAQAMGLHRDGTVFGLRPLATEIRRRLWYHVCLLDSRAAEYHGHEPVVAHDGRAYDTRLPLHINDADLTAEMSAPPPERVGEPCDMTFCRIRCEVMRIGWEVGYAPPWDPEASAARVGGLAERQALVAELAARLQEQYLQHCEGTGVLFHHVILAVTRLILARTWLSVSYPFAFGSRRRVVGGGDGGSSTSTSSAGPSPDDSSGGQGLRDQLFAKTIEILEQSARLITSRDISRWVWHSRTHIQWHAVALALSEICARPPGPDCDRAWRHACAIYDSWRARDQKSLANAPWRPIGPIRRLMAKARYVRVTQRVDAQIAGGAALPPPDPAGRSVWDEAENSTTSSKPSGRVGNIAPSPDTVATGTSSGAGTRNVGDMQGVLGMEYSDLLTDLGPEDTHGDIFNATLQEFDNEFNPAMMGDSWPMQYSGWGNIG